MSKHHKKEYDDDDTEYYRTSKSKLKERHQKRQPRNWKKVWENVDEDEDAFYN